MKFITEEDLRDLYKIQPFTDYDLNEGERLTPGARQFLVDRGIDMYDRNDPYANVAAELKASTAKQGVPAEGKVKNVFLPKFNSVKTLFLTTIKDLINVDVCLSQQLMALYRQYALLSSVSEGKCDAADLCCNACTGMNEDNFSCCLGDCFELTDFHIHVEKSVEMLLMARLRSELQVLEAEADTMICDTKLCECFAAKLNQVINSISQMICAAMGGNGCQRKI